MMKSEYYSNIEIGFSSASSDNVGCKFEFIFVDKSEKGLLEASIRSLAQDQFLRTNTNNNTITIFLDSHPYTKFQIALAE